MMGWSIPMADAYLRLIRAVDRPAFAVHMDVCNGINSPAKFYQSGEFIKECFQKLGPWIASCHAKDLQWVTELNVHFLEVVPAVARWIIAPILPSSRSCPWMRRSCWSI